MQLAGTPQTGTRPPSLGLSRAAAGAAGIEQEFPVAFRSKDGTLDDTRDAPTRLCTDPAGDALAHLSVNHMVCNHSPFTDMLAAGLELRFDESHQFSLIAGQSQRRRQNRR